MAISSSILHPEVRVVVFDLDGTLYSKPGMALRMLCASPLHWRKMWAERKTRKHLRGKFLRDEASFYNAYFQLLAQFADSTPDAMRDWYQRQYMPLMIQVIKKYYTLSTWVKPFINECRKRGIYLIVMSDYSHTHEKLTALGLDINIFDWVVSAPELGGLKPAPQLLQQLLVRMGCTPKQCLLIGDREDTDGTMAHALGAAFSLVQS